MGVSRWERQEARKNRRTFRKAVATAEGRDRFGRIDRILNPRAVSAVLTEQGRRNFEKIDWSK
jgi:hypothetical protein